MACECVKCSTCGGSGSYWTDFSGRFLGQSRCDDLDELEYCEECGGTGLSEVCYECQLEYGEDDR
jgi:hypothetical protein